MSCISAIAKRITNQIAVNDPSLSSIRLEEIEYGITLIILNTCETAIILIVSRLLGILKYMLLALVSLGGLRCIAGGAHLRSAVSCFVFSSATYTGVVSLSKALDLTITIQISIVLLSLLFLFLFSPGDTRNRPIAGPQHRRLLKMCSMIVAAILFVIGFMLVDTTSRNVVFLGVLFESISVTPVFYKLTNSKGGRDYAQGN